jgi:hypothetical protein
MRTFTPADARTLQLDIDSALDLVHFHRVLPWLSCIAEETGLVILAISYRRSRRRAHWHITIRFRARLCLLERLALQAILGSDRMRELCNWERIRARSAYPILLIDPVTGKRRRKSPQDRQSRKPRAVRTRKHGRKRPAHTGTRHAT